MLYSMQLFLSSQLLIKRTVGFFDRIVHINCILSSLTFRKNADLINFIIVSKLILWCVARNFLGLPSLAVI